MNSWTVCQEQEFICPEKDAEGQSTSRSAWNTFDRNIQTYIQKEHTDTHEYYTHARTHNKSTADTDAITTHHSHPHTVYPDLHVGGCFGRGHQADVPNDEEQHASEGNGVPVPVPGAAS